MKNFNRLLTEAIDREALRKYIQKLIPDGWQLHGILFGIVPQSGGRQSDYNKVSINIEFGNQWWKLIILFNNKTIAAHELNTKRWFKIKYIDLDDGIINILNIIENGFI